MLIGRAITSLILVLSGGTCLAQVIRPDPYNPYQLSDPYVGNLEGAHRYGRQLKTDPDVGMGYSFNVRPAKVVQATAVDQYGVERSYSLRGFAQSNDTVIDDAPFDSTAGIRNFGPPDGPPLYPGENVDRALGFLPKGTPPNGSPAYTFPIYHQPLIQIKVRVVEVIRDDTLKVASVLDYIDRKGTATLFSLPGNTGHNVNEGLSRTTTATRFPQPRDDNPGTLINIANDTTKLAGLKGSGALVNLTAKNLNYLSELLAVELGADVLTAPEAVTLNGQNVEFVAGSKVAFPLGQSVISGDANNIQQLFYKHVGTYISVTPTIVNWGKHSEGKGEAVVNATEIPDWSELIRWMLQPQLESIWAQTDSGATLLENLKNIYANKLATSRPTLRHVSDDGSAILTPPAILVPEQTRIDVLDELNRYSKNDLLRLDAPIAPPDHFSGSCAWKPQDCTIDLSIVVRLSEAPGLGHSDGTISTGADTTISTNESNVRAVANVIQVKSGHGVVMAGLIGDRDSEDVRKVPVLGDAPVIGYLFRSKTTNRQKTEILIFVEARVMDPDPGMARAQSYEDFRLGEPYVFGAFLENPLEYGMYRAGFGTYLPPHSHQEKVFWERLGRKVHKAATEIDDALE